MRSAAHASNSSSVSACPGRSTATATATATPTSPQVVRHAEHRDLGDRRMLEDLFLDLPRIHVGAARDVHVRLAAGDIDESFRIHAPEVASAEPAIAEGLCIGLRIVVITGENRRATDADLA